MPGQRLDHREDSSNSPPMIDPLTEQSIHATKASSQIGLRDEISSHDKRIDDFTGDRMVANSRSARFNLSAIQPPPDTRPHQGGHPQHIADREAEHGVTSGTN